MYQHRRNVDTNPILLGERPSFESQLPLAKFGFQKYWKICLNTPYDAGDIYQHCCIGLWKAYRKFDWTQRKAWGSYALSAIRYELNRISTRYKMQKRVPEEIISSLDYQTEDGYQPYVAVENNDFEEQIVLRHAFYSGIKRMKRNVRKIIYKRYLLGMTFDEIAQTENTSKQNIQQILKRAEGELKIFLTKNNPLKVATRT